jgi:AcrR family transcriptional regulator
MAVDLLTPTPAYEEARRPAPTLVETRATPAAAFAAARRTWLAGERLDMQALANELGVARTTLYRWTGGRERLLTDVIWSLAEDLIAQIWEASADRRGANRILKVCRDFVTPTVRFPALQAFLRNETHAALRILTTRGGYQTRLVEAVERLLREEQERGHFVPRADPTILAYAIVRVIEGFTYNDGIAAIDPQIDEAMEIVRLLLE